MVPPACEQTGPARMKWSPVILEWQAFLTAHVLLENDQVVSKVTPGFFKQLNALPAEIQELAYKNFKMWLENPHHPSVQFKVLHRNSAYASARVGGNYRVIGQRTGPAEITWIWIGKHNDYDKKVREL